MTTQPLPEQAVTPPVPEPAATPPVPEPAATPSESGPAVAPRRLTSAALTGGAVVSAACFLVAIGAEIAGQDRSLGDITDLGALAQGLLDFAPWAWASLGTIAIIVTPALGLLVTAYEYRSVADRRTTLLAIAVLAVLVFSAVVAVLR